MSDLSAEAVSSRLRRVAELSDLDPARRLDAKLMLDARSVSARLREVAALSRLCERLASAGRSAEAERGSAEAERGSAEAEVAPGRAGDAARE